MRARAALEAGRVVALLLLAACALGPTARAQEVVEEAVGGSIAPAPGTGTVLGRVFDAASGAPIERATVVLKAAPGPGAAPSQEIQLTDADGAFQFDGVPPGTYSVTFEKSGYRTSTMTDFAVQADQLNRADFPLPPQAGAASDSTVELEEFVVTAQKVEDLMQLRIESDQLLNVVGVEEFAKFAAGDVAEVLERVAGVNIVEGQFAIIRGLEDRYSSTLYNGAPVPSPDPDRQSVQLDLFPSEVVGNLTVAKTFSPELPSNSAGGAIDIITHSYPEEIEFKVKGGTGYNDNAQDVFLDYDGETDVDQLVDGLPPDQDITVLKAEGFEFVGGNPVGEPQEKTGHWFGDVDDVLESDFVASLGGRREFEGREFRLKAVYSHEVDYSTALGTQEARDPRGPVFGPPSFVFDPVCGCIVVIPGTIQKSGDLTLGQLSRSEGSYDLTISQREEQTTGYGAFGFDLDDEGNHKLDASFFWTRKEEATVEAKENGFLPGFDYATVSQQQLTESIDPNLFVPVSPSSFIGGSIRPNAFTGPSLGALAFTNFGQSTSFERDRDLWVAQLNGDHTFDPIPGLHFSWAMNLAETTQNDSALGMKYFFEPCGYSSQIACPPGIAPIPVPTEFPTSLEELGPGAFATRNLTLSANRVEESSRFYRLDADYETDFSDESTFFVGGGVWFERADRAVDSAFLETPIAGPDSTLCSGNVVCVAATPLELGAGAFNDLAFQGATLLTNGNIAGMRVTTNESERAIDAWHLRGKLTFWERVDVLGGVRGEHISITSRNDPFIRDPVTGAVVTILGGPNTFPSRFLFFDRLDNPFFQFLPDGTFVPNERTGPPPVGFVFNDQLLGLGLVPGPCAGDTGAFPGITCVDFRDEASLQELFDGEIEERRTLPSAGFAIRPIEGMTLRGAWSQTVARPSFREMGYYVSVEPGSDDLIVGNPNLQLSDVESWDARLEYTWGGLGDLFALSYFQKTVENPIESFILRDPINAELSSGALFRTFFNNPNTADLWGAEAELRKSIDFLGPRAPYWLRYLSIGGNFTWIHATVKRTEVELARSQGFFGLAPGDVAEFDELDDTRRLYNQPEWIANFDVSFDHPDWGLKATVAWFAISNVLDAAGTAFLGPTGATLAFTLDRYVDTFQELRATVAKTFLLPDPFGELTFRITGKNLTDSKRSIVYDPFQTGDEIPEREVRLGRDYDFSITYTRRF